MGVRASSSARAEDDNPNVTESRRQLQLPSAAGAEPDHQPIAGNAPSMYQLAKQGYEEVVRAIIRPPRSEYDEEDLGSRSFAYKGVSFIRLDFEVVGVGGDSMHGSLWRPAELPQRNACVLYLHGNSGCRLGALEIMPTVLNEGACVASFDCPACGMSTGGRDYVTLGHREAEDALAVIAHVRTLLPECTIALWGRSMGAVTAIGASQRDPSIAALVLDSPFSDLKALCMELVGSATGGQPLGGLPKWAIETGAAGVLRMVRSTILKRTAPPPATAAPARAHAFTLCVPGSGSSRALTGAEQHGHIPSAYSQPLDIYALRPIDAAPSCFVPALFVAGAGDTFVGPHHAQALADAYAGDHMLHVLEGQDHNSLRPQDFLDAAGCFLRARLGVPEQQALWARPAESSMRSGARSEAERVARRQALKAARRSSRAAAFTTSSSHDSPGTPYPTDDVPGLPPWAGLSSHRVHRRARAAGGSSRPHGRESEDAAWTSMEDMQLAVAPGMPGDHLLELEGAEQELIQMAIAASLAEAQGRGDAAASGASKDSASEDSAQPRQRGPQQH